MHRAFIDRAAVRDLDLSRHSTTAAEVVVLLDERNVPDGLPCTSRTTARWAGTLRLNEYLLAAHRVGGVTVQLLRKQYSCHVARCIQFVRDPMVELSAQSAETTVDEGWPSTASRRPGSAK